MSWVAWGDAAETRRDGGDQRGELSWRRGELLGAWGSRQVWMASRLLACLLAACLTYVTATRAVARSASLAYLSPASNPRADTGVLGRRAGRTCGGGRMRRPQWRVNGRHGRPGGSQGSPVQARKRDETCWRRARATKVYRKVPRAIVRRSSQILITAVVGSSQAKFNLASLTRNETAGKVDGWSASGAGWRA
ncbi:hypothetical protein F4780DRAFT_750985, partial [Xylariomycetidae sp. FL0641]